MITYKSIVEKIMVNIKIGDKTYKDITLDYTPDHDWCLMMCDLHYEENDSWCCTKVGNDVFDIQLFGEDDTLAFNEETREFDDRKAMTIPIHFQMNKMVYDAVNDCYNHTDEWFYSPDVKFKNVRVYTNNGMKRIKIY